MAGAWLLASPAMRAAADNRTLKFSHTHTGEQLVLNYWRDGALQTASLEALNHFLRDFRTGEQATIDVGLLEILFELQALSGRDAIFEVISAYRSPQTNAMLARQSAGVSRNSLHMAGRAIDIRITGFSTAKLHELALAHQHGGVGYYAKSDFVHLDTGRVRSWLG